MTQAPGINNVDPDVPPSESPRLVALFVTCLADLMRPSVAFASVKLLEDAGCDVVVPRAQSCCGQPGYNSGDYTGAATLAKQVIRTFENYEHVVLPSGSCAGMMIRHYPRLFEGEWRTRAEAFASRVRELTDFLHSVCGYRPTVQGGLTRVAYHDSCAGLRELGLRDAPRELLAAAGVAVHELQQRDVCCGFGGTFCAKMPAISAKMADDKLRDLETTGADTLLAGDLGCLLALAGRASRCGKKLAFRHVAEVLAGQLEEPAIGVAPERR
ncbi:MAG: L-lactate dehydrogenase complex protein LldE [Halieaceae bacterium]|jgi:L-lactate dehydrogenase complex protein LldE